MDALLPITLLSPHPLGANWTHLAYHTTPLEPNGSTLPITPLSHHPIFFFSIKEQNENKNNNSNNNQPHQQTTNNQNNKHTHTTHTGAAAGLNQPAETAGQPNMLCDSQFTTDRLERLVPETHTTHTGTNPTTAPKHTTNNNHNDETTTASTAQSRLIAVLECIRAKLFAA